MCQCWRSFNKSPAAPRINTSAKASPGLQQKSPSFFIVAEQLSMTSSCHSVQTVKVRSCVLRVWVSNDPQFVRLSGRGWSTLTACQRRGLAYCTSMFPHSGSGKFALVCTKRLLMRHCSVITLPVDVRACVCMGDESGVRWVKEQFPVGGSGTKICFLC